MKNAGIQISMFFTSHKQPATMAIEKIKILGAVLELTSDNLNFIVNTILCYYFIYYEIKCIRHYQLNSMPIQPIYLNFFGHNDLFLGVV